MNIAEVAEEFGVSPAALRHYESLGLLDDRHVCREPNGYRRYTEAGVERIRLLLAGKAVGLSLRQIGDGIDRWESGAMPEEERVALFSEHLAALERRIEAQIRVRDYLRSKLGR